jgi:hypothetical protein
MGGLGSYSDLDLTLTGRLDLEMEHEERLEVSSRPSSLNHALPFELLGEIFSHISKDSLDLRYVIFVCRTWHNAVVHHANLWTNIILGYTFLTRFRGARLRHGDAFVHLCVLQSSPLPLHISIQAGYKSPHDDLCGELYDKCFSLLKHILDKNSGEPENLFQRCRSLSWAFGKASVKVKGMSDRALAARTFISASFPALEYMTIDTLVASNLRPRIDSPRFPRLKAVTLINYTDEYTPPFFHDNDFANVERLTFVVTIGCRWMRYDVACIRRFRNIRILILKGENIYDDEDAYDDDNEDDVETQDDKPVELPLLETLTLSGNVQRLILNPIRTPGLGKLEIEPDNATGYHPLVASNLVHLVASLEHLCVSFSEEIHGTSWVEELERVIAEAPSLVSVWVSPWMVRHLIGKAWGSKVHVTDPK